MPCQAKRDHDISCGHRVLQHETKSALLHGHNYRVHFTCEAEKLDSIGRVIDFSDIKAKLCMWLEDEWDHKTLIWENDPWAKVLPNIDPTIVIVPFNPTAENIAQHLVEVIGPQQLAGTGIKLVHCDVEETRKCSASFHV